MEPTNKDIFWISIIFAMILNSVLIMRDGNPMVMNFITNLFN